jgi:protein required for attachment to host cells
VADGARARFFTLNETSTPHLEGGPRLLEHEELSNPEGAIPPRNLFSNVRGRHHSHRGGSFHNYDDHRSQHEAVVERRFARKIALKTVNFAQQTKALRWVIAATPKMLGFLRQELEGLVGQDVRISELAKDLSKLSAADIQAHLAVSGLVPERKLPRTV